jgi:hypothetical protein
VVSITVVSVIASSSKGGTIGISFIFSCFVLGSGGNGEIALGLAMVFFDLAALLFTFGFAAFFATGFAEVFLSFLEPETTFFTLGADFFAPPLAVLFLAFLDSTFFEDGFFFKAVLAGLDFFPEEDFFPEAFLGFCFFLVAIVLIFCELVG